MIKQVFAVQDVKVSVFYPPVALLNENDARRMLCDAVNNSETIMNKHPKDFRLFKIGEFNDNSGVLSPLAQPEFVCDAFVYFGKRSDEVTEDILIENGKL